MNGILDTIDNARRDLQIAAEYKDLPRLNDTAREVIEARKRIAEMMAFWRKAAPIASRIVGARTHEEEIAACREMAKLYNDDLDATLYGDAEDET